MLKAIVSTGVMMLGMAAMAAEPAAPQRTQAQLETTIQALDTAVFEAFNRCSDSAQLDRHASYFAEDVEFYHDTGGVTWSREAMLDNTRSYVCGKFRRERIDASFKVFPVKDFGAIAQGTHRFCQFDSGRCEGEADFTMLWQEKEGAWRLTRVLSYGHRPAAAP